MSPVSSDPRWTPPIPPVANTATPAAAASATEVFQRAIDRGEVRPDIPVRAAVEFLGGLIAMRVITGEDLPALDELDDEKRAVLVLAELEQMSAPDIAEALGINLNTAYARLRAARQQFEQAVARERARDGWRLR